MNESSVNSGLEQFAEFLRSKGKPEDRIRRAQEHLSHFLQAKEEDQNHPQAIRAYCDKHIAGKTDAVQRIISLFWYHDHLGDKPASTYLITLLGTLDVIENQEKRLRLIFGDTLGDQVYRNLYFPSLGSDLDKYPGAIIAYLNEMRSCLSESECQQVLAGNHHDVDTEPYVEARKRLAEHPDLPSFLKNKHQELVNKLQKHAETGELWFEQYITPEVVEYVRNHQEIQTGILEGNRILVSKIPYNPSAWLKETDPIRKRYHACHCPFVRSAILAGLEVPDLWCYCSGGFTKLFFDCLFDREHQVELLESVLSGGQTCSFAIYSQP